MKTTITIRGTHCNSCKELIEDACSEIEGIKSCKLDLKSGKAVLVHDGNVDLKKVKNEIESLGEYKVTL